MFNRINAVFAAALSLLVPSFAYAAESDEAAKTTDSGSGGYGAPEMKITHLAGSPALLMGSQGGWVAKHHFILGGAGYGLVSDVTSKGVPQQISLGYGGLRLGFILGEKDDRFHFGGGAIFGGAGMSVGDRSTMAWVIEPDVNADVSALKWLRIGVSAGYRFMIASSDNDANLTTAQMSGFTAGLQFKFGSF